MFRLVKLSDIGEIVSGGTPKTKVEEYWNGSIPWITPKDLSTYTERYISEGERFISKEGLKNSSAKILPKGSILFTSRAPIGYIAIADRVLSTNQGFKNIIVNDKNNNLFVFYLLKKNVDYIKSLSNGSTFMEVSGSVMKNIELPVPSLKVQKEIAQILSTLDEKIEVNNRINKTLESIVQEIFKRWFVDFEFPNEDGEPYQSRGGEMVKSELGLIPKGWIIKKLQDFADITMGQSPPGHSLNENCDGEVFYQGRTDFNFRFPSRRIYTTEPKRIAKEDAILLSVRAPVGDVNIANEKCCIGRGLAAVTSKNHLSSFLLYLLKTSDKYFSVYDGTGTVFGSINQNELKNLSYVISPDYIIEERFNSMVKDIDAQIKNFEKQSTVLCGARDLLIPKLMSGEIRVAMEES